MLEVDRINTFYGAMHILKDLSLEVREGELVALIGSNGAGKTTLLNAITGNVHPVSGVIKFMGERIDHLKPNEIVSRGIVLVPEGKRLFPYMTVLENLELGAYSLGKQKNKIAANLDKVFQMFPLLAERRKKMASTLSGGEQQMLAISRGMMADPKLLMFDELSMGLAPKFVEMVCDTIQLINSLGTTVLLIEQNVEIALRMAHRAYVIEVGRVTLSGEAIELLTNNEVRMAYLGQV